MENVIILLIICILKILFDYLFYNFLFCFILNKKLKCDIVIWGILIKLNIIII